MRLDKYLAETAQCTRSEAKALLAKGRVTVNGAVCKKGDTQLKCTDTVAVDGAPLRYQKFVYLMLNKPEGVVSASTDKRDTTVVDLVRDAYPRRALFPAGRLDKDTTGLMILTDDGALAHEILAPKKHVPKQYRVTIDVPMTEEMVRRFAEGIRLKDNASDASLQVVREVDLETLLARIPACRAVVTTGQKATDTLRAITGCGEPAVGECVPMPFAGRDLTLWRLPSSSRAFPRPVEWKAEFYRKVFSENGIL